MPSPKQEVGTARVTVLMTPAEKRQLTAVAKQRGDSVGAYLRDKAFDRGDQSVQTAIKTMDASIAATITALDKAIATIDTLAPAPGAST